MNINDIEVGNTEITIRGFYSNPANRDEGYDFGLFHELPKGRVRNPYRGPRSFCGNRLIWAYNNPCQPHADYDYNKRVKKGFIDSSRANAVCVLGSMKNIWKDFERLYNIKLTNFSDINIEEIDNLWWDYYYTHYKDNFNSSVSILEKYIKKKRALFTEEERAYEKEIAPDFADDDLWIRGCKDYLEYLVRKSAKGFIMELVLFASLREKIGGEIIESDVQDERKGIDGYLLLDGVKYPICVKPDTFYGGVSPIYSGCMVFYNNYYARCSDLRFKFASGFEILGKGKCYESPYLI